MLAFDKGRYRPAEVQPGRESGGNTEILAGLAEGEKIVASGQFLIDSEASLSGVQARPIGGGVPTTAKPATTALYATVGKIEQITANSVTLSHEPVPAIGWRSEENPSDLQSRMRISYAVFCLKKRKSQNHQAQHKSHMHKED